MHITQQGEVQMKKLCFLAVYLLAIGCLHAATWYVATNGNDAVNNGTDGWDQAYATISNAVVKSANGDAIWVSNGLYVLAAQLTVGDRQVRSWSGNPADTIIDGDHAVRCAYLYHTNALLTGFTVRNGFQDNGGGVRLSAGATLSNCWVTGNLATNDNASNPGLGGGGIWFGNGGRVFNCLIADNVTSNFGGGLLVGGASYWGLVRDCLVTNNQAFRGGGGVCNYGGTFTMEDCEIAGNSAGTVGGGAAVYYKGVMDRCRVHYNSCTYSGAGVYLFRAPVGWVRNCLITENTTIDISNGGGGINIRDCGNVANCTITGNTGGKYGGGLYFYNDTATYIGNFYNNIIYDNNVISGTASNWHNGGSQLTNGGYYHCCTAPLGSTTWNAASTNNTTTPPAFLGAGDYHVQPDSPCVNSGTNLDWMSETGAADLDGRTRIDRFSGVADMGCYEYISRGTLFGFR